MTIQLETKRKISEAIEPAKKWRNKWWLPMRAQVLDDGVIAMVGPGNFWGAKLFPSRDVAETAAALDLLKPKNRNLRFVGAFPIEGEAP